MQVHLNEDMNYAQVVLIIGCQFASIFLHLVAVPYPKVVFITFLSSSLTLVQQWTRLLQFLLIQLAAP